MDRSRPALLEREAELDELHVALRHAQHGGGRLVVVEGPAGIGKTRLVRELRETAARSGVRVLAARGSELERDFPFGVVRQLFEPMLAANDEPARRELLAGPAGAAAPVVGIEPQPGGDAAVDRSFATLNGLFWLLSNMSEDAPALVVVDDAHWADQASLRFLAFLLPRLEDLPVLLVVAARPGERDAAVARLATDATARLLRLSTLSEPAVAELVREAIGPAAADDYCAACLQATGGNPFLLHELLVQLAADGNAGTPEEATHVREVVPATISRAVLVRLARAPERAQRLAPALAILGDGAELRLAAELAGLDIEDAACAADDLVAAGVLDTGRPPRFAHPLIRTAIDVDMPDGARAAHHSRAAELLRAEGAEPERVAAHLIATEPGDDEAVVATLRDAARRALQRAAPEAAVRYANRALRERPGGAARDELVPLLVSATARATDRTAFHGIGFDLVAEVLAEPARWTSVASDLAICLYGDRRREEGSRLLADAAHAAAEAGDHDLAVRLETQRMASDQTALPETLRRIATYAGHIAPGTAGERLLQAVEAYRLALTGAPASDAVALARRALEDGRIFTDEPDSPAPYAAVLTLIMADELEVANKAVDIALADARRRGAVLRLMLGTSFRGRLAHLRGDVARAEGDVQMAVRLLAMHTDLRALPPLGAHLLDTLVERDEADDADRMLAAAGLARRIPRAPWINEVLFQRGRLRLAQGRLDEGIADLVEAGRREEATGRVNPAATPWASSVAVALAARGRADEARAAVQEELRRAREWGAPRPIGVALRALGLLKGGEEGIALLREAVAELERSPARLEHARALTDLGAALRRANRRADAREPLRVALEMARGGGALAVARRAHEELTATGERLRPLAPAGAEALTPSERRVAELAASGQTNREIAQTLFLTVKTVETHLSSSYRKLDISSRRELAAALSEG